MLAAGFRGRARSDGAGMSRQDSHFAVYHHLLGPGTKVSRNLCPGLRLSIYELRTMASISSLSAIEELGDNYATVI